MVYVFKKIFEEKVKAFFVKEIEQSKYIAKEKHRLREKKLEAYENFLSIAYRCRNFTSQFILHLPVRGKKLWQWAQSRQGDASTKGAYIDYLGIGEFISNCKNIEDILYSYRLYLHVDVFIILHVYKQYILFFKAGIDEISQSVAENIYFGYEDDNFIKKLNYLQDEALRIDSIFRDIDKAMKEELQCDEPKYWAELHDLERYKHKSVRTLTTKNDK